MWKFALRICVAVSMVVAGGSSFCQGVDEDVEALDRLSQLAGGKYVKLRDAILAEHPDPFDVEAIARKSWHAGLLAFLLNVRRERPHLYEEWEDHEAWGGWHLYVLYKIGPHPATESPVGLPFCLELALHAWGGWDGSLSDREWEVADKPDLPRESRWAVTRETNKKLMEMPVPGPVPLWMSVWENCPKTRVYLRTVAMRAIVEEGSEESLKVAKEAFETEGEDWRARVTILRVLKGRPKVAGRLLMTTFDGWKEDPMDFGRGELSSLVAECLKNCEDPDVQAFRLTLDALAVHVGDDYEELRDEILARHPEPFDVEGNAEEWWHAGLLAFLLNFRREHKELYEAWDTGHGEYRNVIKHPLALPFSLELVFQGVKPGWKEPMALRGIWGRYYNLRDLFRGHLVTMRLQGPSSLWWSILKECPNDKGSVPCPPGELWASRGWGPTNRQCLRAVAMRAVLEERSDEGLAWARKALANEEEARVTREAILRGLQAWPETAPTILMESFERWRQDWNEFWGADDAPDRIKALLGEAENAEVREFMHEVILGIEGEREPGESLMVFACREYPRTSDLEVCRRLMEEGGIEKLETALSMLLGWLKTPDPPQEAVEWLVEIWRSFGHSDLEETQTWRYNPIGERFLESEVCLPVSFMEDVMQRDRRDSFICNRSTHNHLTCSRSEVFERMEECIGEEREGKR